MRTFDTQLEFEEFWFGRVSGGKPASVRSSDSGFFVYFTATWCGACKRLDLDAVEAAAKTAGVPLWKVEQTVNDYTAGFCAVRSLPTFLFITPKVVVSRLSSSRTEDVTAWMKEVSEEKKVVATKL